MYLKTLAGEQDGSEVDLSPKIIQYPMKIEYKKPVMREHFLILRQQLLSISGEISGYSQSSNGFTQEDDGEVKSQGNKVSWEEEWGMDMGDK